MSYLEIYDRLRECAEKEIKKKRKDKIRAVLGYSICSISVGANEVLKELQNTLIVEQLDNVIIETTGCNGLCHKEPLLNIITSEGEKYSYEFVTPEKARSILIAHALYDEFIPEYLIKEQKGEN